MEHMLGNLLKSSREEHGMYQEYGDILIEDICVDSRHVKHGAMFVAIPGTSVKGTDFLQQAVERGALAVVVPQEELADIKTLMPRGFPVIPVADPRYFAGAAASVFYGEPSRRLSLIGITGTNGKTTVSWLLESILVSAGLKPGVIGTINRHFAGRQAASFLRRVGDYFFRNRLYGCVLPCIFLLFF
jgi:UDP-N-acetylmuramoyl-L-alanyl-D-glutamate--2,6-diaminopimelate ligase